MKKIFLLTLSIIFLFACNSQEGTPWEAQYDEVMVIHDEVMPEVKTIVALQSKLKKFEESQGDSMPAAMKNTIGQLRRLLTEAEEGMFDWMHAFKKPERDQDPEKVKAYLASEMVKITKVSNDMKLSISNATAFLEETQK